MSEVESIDPVVPDDLDLDGDGVEGAERGGFSVNTESEASWALGRLLAFDDEEKRIREGYAERMADLTKRRARAEAFFLPMLRSWFERNPPKRGKSVKLLDGVIGVRASKGGPVIRDERAALEWAREHQPDLVKTEITSTLDKVAVKEHAAKSGEVVPGVEVVTDSETFYVRAHRAKGDSDG